MMLIQEYMSKDFWMLDGMSFAREALLLIEDFGFSHVFVEREGFFYGAIRREYLEENQEKTLGELLEYAERFSILHEKTIWDSLKLFNTFDTNVIPVIDENEMYQGYVSCESILEEFSKYPIFSESGAFLIVEISRKNYSMTEISQIVESNNARFYGVLITEMNDDFIRVAMRISHENLTSIGESFERYGYIVVQKFYTDEKEELLKNRYQFMQKYLEI